MQVDFTIGHNIIEMLTDTPSSLPWCVPTVCGTVPHLPVGAIHLPDGSDLLPEVLTRVVAFLHRRDAERRGSGQRGVVRGEWSEGSGQRGVARGEWPEGSGQRGVVRGEWSGGGVVQKWGGARRGLG